MEKIWACEEKYLLDYQNRIENATEEQYAQAITAFGQIQSAGVLTIDGSRAEIEISGPLSRKGPGFLEMLFGFGGTSYTSILEAIDEIKDNDMITDVTLKMDTPGGEVIGVDMVNRALTDLAGSKRVVAENHGLIASAGMWIAAATDEIVAMEPTAKTGSIGVVITAIDRTKMYEEEGIKIVEIVSRNAPNKRPDIKTKAGRDILQEQADAIERVFIDRVAEGRGVSAETVKEKYGRGGLMIAQDPDPDTADAISIGLIDGMAKGPHDMVVGAEDDQAAKNRMIEAHFEGLGVVTTSSEISVETPAVAGEKPVLSGGKSIEEVVHMDLKQAMADHPAIKAEVDKMVAKAREAGVNEGKAQVQKRIEKVAPIMASDDYDSVMKAQCTKALKGEISLEAFESVVSMEDMRLEREKSTQAAEETNELPETPAQAGQDRRVGDANGLISSEADIDALLEGDK